MIMINLQSVVGVFGLTFHADDGTPRSDIVRLPASCLPVCPAIVRNACYEPTNKLLDNRTIPIRVLMTDLD